MPTPSRMIKGNSTTVWPYAILIPAFAPCFKPYEMFAANNGPGDITPDAEINITIPANAKSSPADTIRMIEKD